MRRGRKVSMEEDAMGEIESEPLDMSKIKPGVQGDQSKDLAGLFDKMQIAVVGRETGAQGDSGSEFMESEGEDEGSDAGDIARDEFGFSLEDPNAISNKHNKYADLEARAQEDMDFPDEVDTPFTEARVRF